MSRQVLDAVGRKRDLQAFWGRLGQMIPPQLLIGVYGAGESTERFLNDVEAAPDPIITCIIDEHPMAPTVGGNRVVHPDQAPLDWIGCVVIPPGPDEGPAYERAREWLSGRDIPVVRASGTGWGHTDLEVMQRIHCPREAGRESFEVRSQRPGGAPAIPPGRLSGALRDPKAYLDGGAEAAASLRRILPVHGEPLHALDSVLDWGCQSGRVLRNFAPEAEGRNYWGCDVYAEAIAWCKENLSPPFKFVTTSFIPHLPFEDATFDLVYANSVFTHVSDLVDMWLMEHRRILKPGGRAVFSIIDETTWRHMVEGRAPSIIRNCRLEADRMPRILDADVRVYGRGRRSYVFYRRDFIRREWGRYFEVVEIRSEAMGNQSYVLLKKTA